MVDNLDEAKLLNQGFLESIKIDPNLFKAATASPKTVSLNHDQTKRENFETTPVPIPALNDNKAIRQYVKQGDALMENGQQVWWGWPKSLNTKKTGKQR